MNAQRLQPADADDAPDRPLDYPVIETGLHVDDAGPDLDDYVTSYGGAALLDDLRLGQRAVGVSAESTFHQRPELFHAAQADRGADYSIVFPTQMNVPPAIADTRARYKLWCAVTHYHADRWRGYRARATPAAGIALTTAEEALAQVNFAVKRLGFKVVNLLPACGSAPLDAVGSGSDRFWGSVEDLGTPILIDCRGKLGRSGPTQRSFARTLFLADVMWRRPSLRIALLGTSPGRASSGITRLHDLGESWAGVAQGGLDRDEFRARLFSAPYALYSGLSTFLRGTSVEEKMIANAHPSPAGALLDLAPRAAALAPTGWAATGPLPIGVPGAVPDQRSLVVA